MNVLDLGFFFFFFTAIQSLQHQHAPLTIDQLVFVVEKSFEELSSQTLNHVFLTLQTCMVEVMKVYGGNNYKLPHMGKGQLVRVGNLPSHTQCDRDVVENALAHLELEDPKRNSGAGDGVGGNGLSSVTGGAIGDCVMLEETRLERRTATSVWRRLENPAVSIRLAVRAAGEVICEDLPTDICSFSVASSGKRCLLENYAAKDGKVGYQCRTSEVVVERMAEYIETDECVSACGVDRNSVGISSDSLLEPQSTAKLCSPSCYQNCPNIVDLYFNLADGEGVFLPDLCQKQRTNPRRAMIELLSSGAAPGPVSIESDHLTHVPAPSPAPSPAFF
ncbi:hypothetical protein RHSIM_Rhsim05G0202400 [Rhododendron simsii]|uniref:PAR1 protein n=1 Tax=Rhododendron simsii TaxID=118357 RepID=A0A834LK42_RHOSS|nr:hypothetical protein RHSIM_Rhsim05G0202400 [Rhododendron simsii]